MWAYVPSAGAVLADWGAEVVKIESPTGDPIRGLVNAGVGPMDGITFTWEIFNRGKQGIALDLTVPEAREIVYRLVEQADVFLISLLAARSGPSSASTSIASGPATPRSSMPPARGRAAGGPESNRGGYDSITFWSRGSVSASVTPPDYHRPVGMPAGAFGDSISGMALAGGIAAAVARRALTGDHIGRRRLAARARRCGPCRWASSVPPWPRPHPRASRTGPGPDRRRTPWSTTIGRPTAAGSRCACSNPTSIGRDSARSSAATTCWPIPVSPPRQTGPPTRADIVAELEKTFATKPLSPLAGGAAQPEGSVGRGQAGQRSRPRPPGRRQRLHPGGALPRRPQPSRSWPTRSSSTGRPAA